MFTPNPHDASEPDFTGLSVTIHVEELVIQNLAVVHEAWVTYEGERDGCYDWQRVEVRLWSGERFDLGKAPSDMDHGFAATVWNAIVAEADSRVMEAFLEAYEAPSATSYQAREDELTKAVA